jgi:hypothetical protein
MRRWDRIVLLAGLIALAPVLAGCENFDADKLDIFHLNDKKKLPGERKPLFPEGVPGVTQGIPPEYLKGNQPPPETAQTLPTQPDNTSATLGPGNKSAAVATPGKTAAVEPLQTVPQTQSEAKPKPKPKPKAKAKVKPKHKPKPHPAQVTAQPAATQQPQPVWQEPAQQQQQVPLPWPGSGQTTNNSPWPSAPPPGDSSR